MLKKRTCGFRVLRPYGIYRYLGTVLLTASVSTSLFAIEANNSKSGLFDINAPFGANAQLEIVEPHAPQQGRLVQRGAYNGVHYVFDKHGNATFGLDPEFRTVTLRTSPSSDTAQGLVLTYSILEGAKAKESRRLLWQRTAKKHLPLRLQGLQLNHEDREVIEAFEDLRAKNGLSGLPELTAIAPVGVSSKRLQVSPVRSGLNSLKQMHGLSHSLKDGLDAQLEEKELERRLRTQTKRNAKPAKKQASKKDKPKRKAFTFGAALSYPMALLQDEGNAMSPSMKLSLKYNPKPGWSVAGGVSVPFAKLDPWESYKPQFSDLWYSFGFDYWKSPFSINFSNYGPNKLDTLGAKVGLSSTSLDSVGFANPLEGSLAFGYKFGLNNKQLGLSALDETSKIGCKIGGRINPIWYDDDDNRRFLRTTATLGCRYTIWNRWYVEAATSLVAPHQRKDGDGDFTWGFGYADYGEGKFVLSYANYGTSYFLGRDKPVTNFFDGTISVSSSWKF